MGSVRLEEVFSCGKCLLKSGVCYKTLSTLKMSPHRKGARIRKASASERCQVIIGERCSFQREVSA